MQFGLIYPSFESDRISNIKTQTSIPCQFPSFKLGSENRLNQRNRWSNYHRFCSIDRLSEDPNAWATVTGLFLRSDDKWVDPKHGYPDASKLGAKDLTPQVLKDGWSPAPRPAVEFKPVENTAPVWLSAKVVNGKESATVTVNNVPEALPVLPVEAISPGPSPEWVQAQKSSAPVSEPVSVKNTPAPPSPSAPPPAEPPVEYNPALDIMKASPVTVLKDRY